MVHLCSAGTTGERSHRTTAASLQTTLGIGDAPRGSVGVCASRQRGKRGLDPAPIRPVDEAIMHGVGRVCQSRAYSAHTCGDQGRGMQASASRPGPARSGPADRRTRRDRATVRPLIGLRPAISPGGRVTAAIPDGRAWFGMNPPGTPQARRLAVGRPTVSRGLRAVPFCGRRFLGANAMPG